MKIGKYLLLVLSTGCASPYVVKDYIPDENKTLVNVSFRMTNPGAHSEYMYLSLYSHSSCDEKPVVHRLASLVDYIYGDEHRADFKLPANEVLNLYYTNTVESIALRMKCEWIDSFKLQPGYEYVFEGSNIIPNSNKCHVIFYTRKEGEGRYREMEPVASDLPRC